MPCSLIGKEEEMSNLDKLKGNSVDVGKMTSTISFLGLLFVGLKLTGHIDWAWIWVVLPFVPEVVLTILGVVLFTAVIISESRRRPLLMPEKALRVFCSYTSE